MSHAYVALGHSFGRWPSQVALHRRDILFVKPTRTAAAASAAASAAAVAAAAVPLGRRMLFLHVWLDILQGVNLRFIRVWEMMCF